MKFYVEIIKPSHYDDDYLIQWFRPFISSNTLACLYSLVDDARRRCVLGQDVDIAPNAYDECQRVIPTSKIIRRIGAVDAPSEDKDRVQAAGLRRAQSSRGVVFLAGVQTNQIPRAIELAREFRRSGIQVVIGGFHVSGCFAMLRELPPDIKELQALGVSIFLGEAEGRMADLLVDAHRGMLRPVYNYLGNPPDLRGQPTPFLPAHVARRYSFFGTFDAGRGCPFQCSFCTVINVQGHESRFRDADDIEKLVRANVDRGIRRLFITDDNMARNKNWEPIFDRLIALRENEGIRLKLAMQVDTLAHKIPRFVDKATRAGCNRVFLGLESINPENLAAAGKLHNHVDEYRDALSAWRSHKAITYAGYILGFPADSPESIERDIETIKRDLPIDILEFVILTPLPGSADHRTLWEQKAWLEPDLNKYDLEHVTFRHGQMSAEQLRAAYRRAWELFYSPDHIETILRRAKTDGAGVHHVADAILSYYGSYRFEHLHPLQSGILRRKVRRLRRAAPIGLSEKGRAGIENSSLVIGPQGAALLFYPRRVWETLSTYTSLIRFWLQLERIRKRLCR
jgi:radical SAM superfamily enzyme YgiQ (UPF0313 family)